MLKRKCTPEYRECRAYFEWACLNPLLREYLIKNVNEGKRSQAIGYFLKLIGMRPGLPDYHLPLPNQKYHGLWIEMKPKGKIGKRTDLEQDEWLARLKKIGHYAVYAYGWEEAASITTRYLLNKI